MGRLRDDYEAPLIRGMAEEIVDLYGIDDVVLYRWSAADNITIKDPLWSEPMTTPAYKPFRIKAHRLDPDQDLPGDPEGRDENYSAKLFVALNHLLQALIQPDDQGDYINGGDVILLYVKSDPIYYDIIKINKVGYVNDTSRFSGYDVTVVRREKFSPERKLP